MNNNLLQSVAENAVYVAEFAAIITAMFLIAYFFEKRAKKKAGDTERVLTTRKVAVIGVFSAIAMILHVFDFPVPFAPPFYKLDFSEIPVLIGAFAYGPVTGVMIEFIKILLKLVVKGTSTAFVGDLANFVVGCSFILPASVIYHFKKTRKNAIVACLVGTLTITVCGTLLNAVYLLPAFAALYGTPMENLIAAGTAINPRITNVTSFVILAVAPMNLLKGGLVSLVDLLVYKKLSPILKGNVSVNRPAKEHASVV